MDTLLVIVILAALAGTYLLGDRLIDNYFNRKEKFVDRLQEKMKGTVDGKSE